jgi:hypothetical protein
MRRRLSGAQLPEQQQRALIGAGRFKACRARLTDQEWFAVLGSGSGVFGVIEPADVKYGSWLELIQAVIDSGCEYNDDTAYLKIQRYRTWTISTRYTSRWP